jgi:hypothetical protein
MTGRERLGGKRLICTLLACGVLLSVALAPVAGAHQDRFTNLNWQQNLAIPWQFTGEVPNWAFAAIRGAPDAWNAINRPLQFHEVGGLELAANPGDCPADSRFDYHNGIYWRPDVPNPNWIAYAQPCTFPQTNRLRIVNISFRSTQNWWAGGPGFPGSDQADLQAAATHEFGHFAGSWGGPYMGHFSDADSTLCPNDLRRHTMCETIASGQIWQRTPEPHDIHSFDWGYRGEEFCGTYLGVVYGAIRSEYLAVSGILGCPLDAEGDLENYGRRQSFQAGNIYWHPTTGAHEVHGAILSEYMNIGEAGGRLGYPVTDESGGNSLLFGPYRKNDFQHGSILYFIRSRNTVVCNGFGCLPYI